MGGTATSDDDTFFSLRANYPQLDAVCTRAAQGDWEWLREAARTRRESHGWDVVLECHIDDPAVRAIAADLWARDHRDTLAGQIHGGALVMWAWEGRTYGKAENVSSEQWRLFSERIDLAEQVLIEVTARDPQDRHAWGHRLATARALSLAEPELRRRFRLSGGPTRGGLQACRNVLYYLEPKWFGSWEKASAFATQCADEVPEGHPAKAMIALYQLSRWTGTKGTAESDAHLAQPEVLAALVAADRASVGSPNSSAEEGATELHATFAMLYSLAGEHGAAAPHFRALEAGRGPTPWNRHRTPREFYSSMREAAFKASAPSSMVGP